MKFFILFFIALVLVVAGVQFLDYWMGMSYFDIASTLPVAAFHLFVVGGLGYAFYRVAKHKF